MKKIENKTYYNKRIWLNDEDSPSTGSMVAYDGVEIEDGVSFDVRYLRFTDCYNVIRLHQEHYSTKEDYLKKLRLIKDNLDLYIKHLENSK